MKDYYPTPPSMGQRLRCLVRNLAFVGHDFEVQYTKTLQPMQYGANAGVPIIIDTPCGEYATVCRLCARVEGRRDYRGFLPEFSYGFSPSAGRILEHRQVAHLPIAPKDEPLCGAKPPADLPIPARVRCQKFAWHTDSDEPSMRAHDGGYPVLGGHQSFNWDGTPDRPARDLSELEEVPR